MPRNAVRKIERDPPRQPALIEAMLGDDGDPPCSEPGDCPTCVTIKQPHEGESTVEFGRRLVADLLDAEYRRLKR